MGCNTYSIVYAFVYFYDQFPFFHNYLQSVPKYLLAMRFNFSKNGSRQGKVINGQLRRCIPGFAGS